MPVDKTSVVNINVATVLSLYCQWLLSQAQVIFCHMIETN